MSDAPPLPELRIVPVGSLQPHEFTDSTRVDPLIQRIEQEGILLNPPVVLPLKGGQRYVVLDGANRTVAMQRMGLPHALVQVAEAKGSQVHLSTWAHVVCDISLDTFVEIAGGTGEVVCEPRPAGANMGEAELALLVDERGQAFAVRASASEMRKRLEALHWLVEGYHAMARIERSSSTNPAKVSRMYPGFGFLVRFRPIELDDILLAAEQGLQYPSGLTRFVISPRALRLKYPLAWLRADQPLEMKQEQLAAWLRRKLLERSVRYYEESTFLFDE